MKVPEEIATNLRTQYGMLLYSIVAEDLGGHTFSVTWSDDEGVTTVSVPLTKRAWQEQLKSFSDVRVKELLHKRRASGESADSEA